MNKKFFQVSHELQNWNWLLVPVLPSPIGPITQWLSEAERILGSEDKLFGKPDEVRNTERNIRINILKI